MKPKKDYDTEDVLMRIFTILPIIVSIAALIISFAKITWQ